VASLVYDAAVDAMAAGTIAFAADTFRVMLVDATYTPNKASHATRSDVSGEVIGIGYTAGGAPIAATVSSAVDGQTDIGLGGANWPVSTITARGAVYYDSRGGAASSDELVAYIDFGGDIVSVAGSFSLQPSTVRIQN
jgi:hypothetical protein